MIGVVAVIVLVWYGLGGPFSIWVGSLAYKESGLNQGFFAGFLAFMSGPMVGIIHLGSAIRHSRGNPRKDPW